MNKVVALDGPAGSGKGTVASLVAKRCNLVYIDTGATYRSLALKALESNINLEDKESLIELSKNINITFDSLKNVYLDSVDVSKKIRTDEVSMAASTVSKIPEVRENMVNLQRKLAGSNDCIMEGRDITTVVLPNANFKFYLDAALEERAKRRFKEYKEKNIDITYEEIFKNMEERDYQDMHKEVGSLMRTDSQIYIDSTNMTIEEVVEKIVKMIEEG